MGETTQEGANPFPRIDFGPLPGGLDKRGVAEEEARRDLAKSIEQLLADVHDETIDASRTPELNVAHAQKRIASMMARVARSNNEAATRMQEATTWILRLTWAIAFLTLFTIVLTGVTLWKST